MKHICFLYCALLALSSCGSGSSGSSDDSSSFLGDAAVQLSNVMIVNLNTGNIEGRTTIPDDAESNASYRSSHMILVRIDAGTVQGGGWSGTYADADEDLGVIASQTLYMSIFEVTQGQWTAIMGGTDTPWIFENSTTIVPVTNANNIPVFNVSQEDAFAFAAAVSAKTSADASIPSDEEWEYACRAGSTTLYSWGGTDADGSSEVVNTVANNANVFQTNIKGQGPTAAAAETPDVAVDRGANAFGLYDMHGNISEWTSDGKLRGGSWSDTIFTCRSANKVTVDEDTRHPLAGIRLVIYP